MFGGLQIYWVAYTELHDHRRYYDWNVTGLYVPRYTQNFLMRNSRLSHDI